MRAINNTQFSSSNNTSSVGEYNSEDSQRSGAVSRKDAVSLRKDEVIQKIIQIGMEDKVARSTLNKINVNDAVAKVTANFQQLSIKEGANFVLAVSRLISQGYLALNAELRDFFGRFQDQIMRQEQLQKKQPNQNANSRKNNQKKKLLATAKELAESLSSHGSIDERSNTSIQQPRHISSEERLNLQERNLVSPLLGVDGITRRSGDSGNDSQGSQDSNGFGDKRLQLIGQEEAGLLGAYGGDLNDGGFDYQFSDQESNGSNSQGFDAVRINDKSGDISGELNRAGEEFRERQVLRIVGRQQQQGGKSSKSSKMKRKNKGGDVKIDTQDNISAQLLTNQSDAVERLLEEGVAVTYQHHEESAFDAGFREFSLNLSKEQAAPPISLQSILADTLALDDSSFQTSFSHAVKFFQGKDSKVGGVDSFLDESDVGFAEASTILPTGEYLKNLEKTLLNASNRGFFESMKMDGQHVKEEDQINYYQDLDQNNNDYLAQQDDLQQQDYNNDKEEDADPENSRQENDKQNDRGRDVEEKQSNNLTEDEQTKVSKYSRFLKQLSELVKDKHLTPFPDILKAFKAQKTKAELFYDMLELQKLGQIKLTQTDPLHFSPIQVALI